MFWREKFCQRIRAFLRIGLDFQQQVLSGIKFMQRLAEFFFVSAHRCFHPYALSQRFEGKYGRRAEIFFADVEVAGGADESEYAAAIVADHDDIERYPGGKGPLSGENRRTTCLRSQAGSFLRKTWRIRVPWRLFLYARYTPVAVAGVWKPFQT